MSENWIPGAEALSLFLEKYSNEKHGRIIFGFCLGNGIVRSRGTVIKKVVGYGIDAEDAPQPITEDGNINPDIWYYTNIYDDKAWKKSEFLFESQWPYLVYRIDDVEFDRTDITNLHSRKGIGGRPVKKVEWEAVTHELVDIALSGSASEYDTVTSLRNEIVARLGEGALSDASLKGIISRVFNRHFLKA